MKFSIRNAIIAALFLVWPTGSFAQSVGYVVYWGYGLNLDSVPTTVSTGIVHIADQPLTNAAVIAAGHSHALAIRSDGTIVGFGLNNRGQATGQISVPGARASGVVTIAGKILTNAIAISASRVQSQAILADGTVATWGTEFEGGVIRMPDTLSNVVSIAVGYGVAVKANGMVVKCAGGREQTIAGLSNIVAVSAPCSLHGPIVALQRDGNVVVSTLAKPPTTTLITSNVTAISAGGWQNLALKNDKTVFGWGERSYVPPGLSNVVAISAGGQHSLALRADGTVVGWGRSGAALTLIPAGLSNVVGIAAGNNFSLAITTNSAVAEQFRRNDSHQFK